MPSSTAGKLLGAVGVVLGILVVSLPVPIITNKVGANHDTAYLEDMESTFFDAR